MTRCIAHPQIEVVPFPDGSVVAALGWHGHKDGRRSDFWCQSSIKQEETP